MNPSGRVVILAVTGASGSVYGVRIAEELLRSGREVDMIVSGPGRYVLERECGITLTGEIDADARTLAARFGSGVLRLHANDDLSSPLASGSSLRGDMVIAPCTMGTAGRVAAGISSSLIERAADVTLKEKRRLVVLPRETPLSAIHLENLLALARAGAVVLPPIPAFYGGQATVDDLVNFVVGKVLDVLGVENHLFKRWKGDRLKADLD